MSTKERDRGETLSAGPKTLVKLESIPKPVTYSGVAILFAISGYFSASYFTASATHSFPDAASPALPIPFAVLCSIFLVRRWWNCIGPILMVVVVWPLAYLAGTYIGMFTPSSFTPACGGGLIGGIGLVLCAAVSYRRLLSWRYVLGGGGIGFIAGLAFSPFIQAYKLHFDCSNCPWYPEGMPSLLCAFGVWQAAVGTYLFVVSSMSELKVGLPNQLH